MASHIPMVAPSSNEEIYVNYKSYHSIIVQAICDDVFKFIDVVVKWPGSTHDAFIWRQSGIIQKITNKEIPIIDGGFSAIVHCYLLLHLAKEGITVHS